MKTFLNVLYRRILYKIPLKLLLILVVVFGVLFVCFSSAGFNTVSFNGSSYRNILNVSFNSSSFYANESFILVNITNDTNSIFRIQCKPLWGGSNYAIYTNFEANTTGFAFFRTQASNEETSIGLNCTLTSGTFSGTINYSIINKYGFFTNENEFVFENNCDCPTCEKQYTSLQCQTEYNLIPVSSVDSAYCENNNLCSSSDCPSYTGDLTPGLSNIFINDIFHPGAFNVIMNIPQEINWDYAYTNSGQNLNIDVVGYNVDYEKMQTVIDNQNFKPSSEDLSLIVSTIIPLFVPGLVILLFLYFVFRFIKKIF